jgi:hypothetical protein
MVTFSVEALGVIATVVAALAAAIQKLFAVMLQHRNDERDIWRSIAEDATAKVEELTERLSAITGTPPPAPVAPVLPEHNSPTTDRQRDTAAWQTVRARLVAAALQAELAERI